MGKTLIPVPFWADDFPINEVTEASELKWMRLRNLRELPQKNKNYSSLYRVPETGEYTLQMRDGRFITFEPAPARS